MPGSQGADTSDAEDKLEDLQAEHTLLNTAGLCRNELTLWNIPMVPCPSIARLANLSASVLHPLQTACRLNCAEQVVNCKSKLST